MQLCVCGNCSLEGSEIITLKNNIRTIPFYLWVACCLNKLPHRTIHLPYIRINSKCHYRGPSRTPCCQSAKTNVIVRRFVFHSTTDMTVSTSKSFPSRYIFDDQYIHIFYRHREHRSFMHRSPFHMITDDLECVRAQYAIKYWISYTLYKYTRIWQIGASADIECGY